MIDRYGRLFATRGRDNAAVTRRYLQGLTQAARGTFAAMADVVQGGWRPAVSAFHQQLAVVP